MCKFTTTGFALLATLKKKLIFSDTCFMPGTVQVISVYYLTYYFWQPKEVRSVVFYLQITEDESGKKEE
jgi:hypothetical protein